MSKKGRKARKAGKHAGGGSREATSLRVLEELEHAEQHLLQGEPEVARDWLEALSRRYPSNPDILGQLLNVYHALDDMDGYRSACERLLRLTPDNPDLLLGLERLAKGELPWTRRRRSTATVRGSRTRASSAEAPRRTQGANATPDQAGAPDVRAARANTPVRAKRRGPTTER